MRIEQLTLHHIALPLVEPFETSFGVETERECLIVELRADGLTGWGEAPVSKFPGYSYETVGTAWHVVSDFLAPLVLGGDFDSAAELAATFSSVRGHPMAKAGVEAALWDALAKMRGVSLQSMFGGSGRSVEVGVSVGLQPTPAKLVERIARYRDAGYGRVKIKIKPGRDVQDAQAVRAAFPKLRLQVDANSAYRLSTIEQLRGLDELGLLLIEQPLAEDDILDHVRVQAVFDTPICLDESIRSCDDARRALDAAACRVINIKPARVSGFAEALRIHDLCAERSVPVWCGGMLETGIGRAGNLALASLPQFIMPGDISATERYYERDIVEHEFRLTGDSTIEVPTEPGIGVAVSRERVRVQSRRIETFVAE